MSSRDLESPPVFEEPADWAPIKKAGREDPLPAAINEKNENKPNRRIQTQQGFLSKNSEKTENSVKIFF